MTAQHRPRRPSVMPPTAGTSPPSTTLSRYSPHRHRGSILTPQPIPRARPRPRRRGQPSRASTSPAAAPSSSSQPGAGSCTAQAVTRPAGTTQGRQARPQSPALAPARTKGSAALSRSGRSRASWPSNSQPSWRPHADSSAPCSPLGWTHPGFPKGENQDGCPTLCTRLTLHSPPAHPWLTLRSGRRPVAIYAGCREGKMPPLTRQSTAGGKMGVQSGGVLYECLWCQGNWLWLGSISPLGPNHPAASR